MVDGNLLNTGLMWQGVSGLFPTMHALWGAFQEADTLTRRQVLWEMSERVVNEVSVSGGVSVAGKETGG